MLPQHPQFFTIPEQQSVLGKCSDLKPEEEALKRLSVTSFTWGAFSVNTVQT